MPEFIAACECHPNSNSMNSVTVGTIA